MNGEPHDDPQEDPDWLKEFMAEHAEWRPPNPRDREAMLSACAYWHDDYIEIADEQGQRDISDELKRLLAVTKALAWAAETNGIDSTPLVSFMHDATGFYYKLEERLPTASPAIHVLLDRLRFKLEGQQPPPTIPAAPIQTEPPPHDEPPPPPVVLRGRGELPLIRGKPAVKRLSVPQYAVVEALLKAGEAGLTKDQLAHQSKKSDAVNILKRLAKQDGWKDVIQLAGGTGGGYRLL